MFSSGQNQFRLNSAIDKTVLIEVNGDTINLDSAFISIKTNYPEFDTLTFLNETGDNSTLVICNFKPDSVYSLYYACCGSIDVLPFNKIEFITRNNIQYDDNRYQALLMDRPYFTLNVTNQSNNDSIYGWYSDHACFPKFKLLSFNDWEYGVTEKCYYWNNISNFVFFKSNADYSDQLNEEDIIEDWFPYPNDDKSIIIEKIGSICVRLFDNDRYTITYDAQSSTVSLELDKQ